MNVLDWLLAQDKAVAFICRRDLLDEVTPPYVENSDFVARLLSKFDEQSNMFGGGVYSPKYTSTHYTVHTLQSLLADPTHPYFQRSVEVLLKELWPPLGQRRKNVYQDLCVAAMVLDFSIYAKVQSPKQAEIIDYLLLHQMEDGGFNCQWHNKKKPNMSSLHTTLTCLETFATIQENHFEYRLQDILVANSKAVEFLASRKLFLRRRDQSIIHPSFVRRSFPTTWRYTIIRALDTLTRLRIPMRFEWENALQLLIKQADRSGRLPVEAPFAGLYYFRFESLKDSSAIHTAKLLRILKWYKPEVYQSMIATPLEVSNQIEAFWQRFLKKQSMDKTFRYYSADHFGDSMELSNELLQLVLDGKKTGTCGRIKNSFFQTHSMVQVGDYSIMTTFDLKPKAIIQTTSIWEGPIDEVPWELAILEGEDETFSSWKEGHIRYFDREAHEEGTVFDLKESIVFEQFNVVYQE